MRKLILFLISLSLSFGALAKDKKILILYSSIGNGHISAANAIKADILEKNPKAKVRLKNIRDFIPSRRKEKWDEKLFWFVVKNYPNTFDKIFRKKMAQGNQRPLLGDAGAIYDNNAFYKYINNFGPDVVLSAHYGSTEELIKMKENGRLKTTKVGWLHTDYFKGYFPRIAKSIDKSFVAHPDMEAEWIKEGVNPSNVETTGMPLNPVLYEKVDRASFLTSEGWDPKATTISIASGGEGVGDFPAIVKSILKENDNGGKIQIAAFCARNKENFMNLKQMEKSLPDNVSIKVFEFAPQNILLSYIKSSDVYITKSGGLSPAEGFVINRPMILLDIYGGHERDNAEFFEKLKLSVINREYSEIGGQVKSLLNDEKLKAEMSTAQTRFANSFNIDKISDFALNAEKNAPLDPRIGMERGTTATGTAKALAELDKAAPSDLEIILNFPTHHKDSYLSGGGDNPFGHLAIRVKDKVITANHIAKPGEDPEMLKVMSLEEYLYSLTPRDKNEMVTSSFGQAYGRDSLGLRVQGVSKSQVDNMIDYIKKINKRFQKGTAVWHLSQCNCADHTLGILKAGGFPVESIYPKNSSRFSMPLDIFDNYLKYFQSHKDQFRLELVNYQQVRNSKAKWRFNKFPVTPYQLKRSLKHVLADFKGGNKVDPIMERVTKRLATYHNSLEVSFENLDGYSDEEWKKIDSANDERVRIQLDDLKKAEQEFERAHKGLKTAGVKASTIKQALENRNKDLSEEAYKAMSRYEDSLAKLAIAQHDYLVYSSVLITQRAFYKVKNSISKEDEEALLVHLKKIEQYSMAWNQNKYLYGNPKFYKASFPFRKLMRNTKLFYDKLNTIEGTTKVGGLVGKVKKLPATWQKIFGVMKNGPWIMSAIKDFFMLGTGENGNTKRTTRMMGRVFRAFGNINGYDVTIEGEQNLDLARNLDGNGDKVVNLITPTHKHNFLDNVIAANLRIQNGYVFAAVDQFSPTKYIANQLSKAEGVVVVGRGSDTPIEDFVTKLKRNKYDTSNALIFPEGAVPSMEEPQLLRDKFNWGLIQRLKDEGYKVNIIPISLTSNSQFMLQMPKDASGKHLKAVVHRPITDITITRALKNSNTLNKSESKRLINSYISALWSQQRLKDKNKIDGFLRVNELKASYLKYIGALSEDVTLNQSSTCHDALDSLL